MAPGDVEGGCSLFSTHLYHYFLLTGWTPHTLPLQGNFFSDTWSTPCPSFCTVCRAVSHILSLLPLAAVVRQLFPFLECVIRGTTTFPDELSLGGPEGQSWSQLVLASLDVGEASRSFSQKPPLWSPSTKTLPDKGNTTYVSLAFKRYRLSFFQQIDQRDRMG